MISKETAAKALREVKRASDYELFYRELTSPDWISPLRELEQFSRPVEPKREGDYIKFPPWPPAGYLARMAPVAPEAVRDVVLQVPEVGNPRIHVDFVDAALAMPAHVAATLVPKVTDWVRAEYQLFHVPEKVGQLVVKLATQGRCEGALDLARAVLALRPDPRASQDRRRLLSTRAVAYFDHYQYREILKHHVPRLVQSCGAAAFDLLCDVLEDAIRISIPDAAAKRSLDAMQTWRPAIEDHEQNHDFGEPEALVSAVRDAAQTLLDGGQLTLHDLVARLEARGWPVFRRIALHTLRQNRDAGADLIRERILEPGNLSDANIFHEFWLLVRDFMPRVAEADVNRLKSMIDQAAKAYAEHARDLDAQERVAAEARWKLRQFAILEGVLPPSWSAEYEALRDRYQPPEHPDLLSYSGATWVGPRSPKTADELKVMSISDLITFLRTWIPPGGRFESTRDGLGGTLSSVVAENPDRYADAADQFVGLDPAYVRGLLGGLREARRAKRAFAWRSVLSLCRWVIRQPREIPGYSREYADLDPGWVWTRKAIADLLSTALEGGEDPLPIDLREAIWEVLEPLCSDPEPTPADEDRLGGPNMDPVTLSINTTRGEAMHAALHYAIWVARARRPSDRVSSFADMPEVQRALEARLDPAHDPSQAVRAVYGMWLPSLASLDSAWLRENLDRIFPTSAESFSLRDAAWNAYIVWAGVHDSLFQLLRTEYRRAMDNLAAAVDKRTLYSHVEHLAQHLMVLYWRGSLNLGDPDQLLETFFSRASVELRAHALGFVGRNLEATQGEIPPEIAERLRQLWNTRRTSLMPPVQKEQSSAELASFGSWFASGKFDAAWSIGQLIEVLGTAGSIDATHGVVDKLAEYVEGHTRDVLIALRLIVKVDRQWGVGLWRESAERVVRFGLSHSDPELQQLARDSVNILLAAGRRDLEHLLTARPDE